MVDVVKRHTPQHATDFRRNTLFQNTLHRFAKSIVLFQQQRLIRLPGGFGQLPLFRARKEVRSLERERTAFAALKPSPNRIFPIGGVQCHFPDIVAIQPGRQAACFAVTPFSDCQRLGPCQVLRAKPSSNRSSRYRSDFTSVPRTKLRKEWPGRGKESIRGKGFCAQVAN